MSKAFRCPNCQSGRAVSVADPPLPSAATSLRPLAKASATPPSGSGARSRVPADEPVTAKPRFDKSHVLARPPTANRVGILMPRHHQETKNTEENCQCDDCPTGSNGPQAATGVSTANLGSLPTQMSLCGQAWPGQRRTVDVPPGKCSVEEIDTHNFAKELRRAIAAAQAEADGHVEEYIENGIHLVYDQDPEEILAAVAERISIRPAMDSGSVANVIHPRHLPGDVEVTPNKSGNNFSGAGSRTIARFGTCTVVLEGEHGEVDCNWDVAAVTRPLHAVSQVTGPVDKPAKTNVLFDNERCVVVPPGILALVLKYVKPLAEYKREGNLDLADMSMSAFGRQGLQA